MNIKPTPIIEIGLTDQCALHVSASAATEIIFEIEFEPDQYHTTLTDVCKTLPALLQLDVETAEMYDDAGRTKITPAYAVAVDLLKRKYKSRLTVIEGDLLEG